MPTPRKSLETHRVQGTLKPRHERGGPPICRDPIGRAPEHFSVRLSALWDEIVAHIPAGLGARPDRFLVEMATVQTARLREDPAGVKAAELAQLRATLAALGMTPGGRALLIVPPEPEGVGSDPAEQFFEDSSDK